MAQAGEGRLNAARLEFPQLRPGEAEALQHPRTEIVHHRVPVREELRQDLLPRAALRLSVMLRLLRLTLMIILFSRLIRITGRQSSATELPVRVDTAI